MIQSFLLNIKKIAISLADQLKLFKEYTQKLKNLVGEEETNTIFTNSLFAVVVGSNDIANAYYNSHIRQLQFSIFAYTDFLATSASNFLQVTFNPVSLTINFINS